MNNSHTRYAPYCCTRCYLSAFWQLQPLCVTLRVGREVDRLGHVCLGVDNTGARVTRFGGGSRHRGHWVALDDTRSSPHSSVVALECLDVRGERGEYSCYYTAQPIHLENVREGQVLFSEGKGRRVKQNGSEGSRQGQTTTGRTKAYSAG